MFWDFYLPPIVLVCGELWLQTGREEDCSLPLADLVVIIEMRGVGVLTSTLDGDRIWCRGPVEAGVPD